MLHSSSLHSTVDPFGIVIESDQDWLRLDFGAPVAAPAVEGSHVVLHRSAAVRERYESLPAGIEQTFVVSSDPGGDLLLEGRVESSTPGVEENGAIRFGELVYKDLFVWDAAGRPLHASLATSSSGHREPTAVRAARFLILGGEVAGPVADPAIAQYCANGATRVVLGGVSCNATLVFKGKLLHTSMHGGEFKLEVEVKAVGTDFNGTGTSFSTEGVAGTTASVTIVGIAAGPKHWRARVVYPGGLQSGRWVYFGGNTEAFTDFRVP